MSFSGLPEIVAARILTVATTADLPPLEDPGGERYVIADSSIYTTDGTSWTKVAGGGSGGGDVSSNTSSSVNSEVALFSGTGGKTIKRATGTGVAHLTSGVLSASSVDLTSEVTGTLPVLNGGTGVTTSTGSGNNVLSTSAVLVTPALGTPSSGVATNLTGLPLTSGVTGTLPIGNGGTGQTTKAPAFDALSPTTTKGDIIAYDTTANIRVAVGTDGKVLTADSAAAAGVSWQPASGTGTVTSVAMSVPTFLSVAGSPVTTTGTLAVTLSGTALPVLNGGTGTTTSTGSGNTVLSSSPTLVTPVLGVATATSINKVALTAPATSSTLTVADGKTLTASNTLTMTATDGSTADFGAGGTVAYTGNNLSVFASTTSAQLAGVLSDETGSGAAVFATSPTLVTPAIGTPSSGVATNLTGLPLSTGVTGTLPVLNGGTGVTTSTGSGNNVLSTSPTLVTPILGTPTSGTLTNATGLPLTTGVTGTLPVANGGTGLATITSNKLIKGAGSSAAVVTGINVGANDELSLYLADFDDQTGTTYTLASTDRGMVVTLTNASAITLTLPNSLFKGFTCLVYQGGSGVVTFSAGAGATLRSRQSFTKTAGQYAVCSLVCVSNAGGSSAVFVLGGDGSV